MIRVIVIPVLAVSGLMASGIPHASACSKTNGCVMDVFREDYEMKRNGKMGDAMMAGRANIEAFQALQAAEHGRPTGAYPASGKR